MKRAGDLLAAIIDANLYSKARAYSGFFSSWDQITQGCGLAAAGGHSRVRELERGILLVEADHPGWVQILQTKAPQIMSALRRRFPELDVRGISFVLGKLQDGPVEKGGASGQKAPEERAPPREDAGGKPEEGRVKNWEQIGDPDLKDSLKQLEQSLRAREKSAARRSGGKK